MQDLFEISKANSGAIDLEPERIDVVALAEQTIAEMDERVNPSGVEIKAQLAPQRLFVWADGRKLHRVFENLLGNALKYSLAGTRVYIVVRQAEETAEISFKNVASYEMTFTAEDIVERFQRGDASRTGEGSGLGLAIAKSFVELSGGALSIELERRPLQGHGDAAPLPGGAGPAAGGAGPRFAGGRGRARGWHTGGGISGRGGRRAVR